MEPTADLGWLVSRGGRTAHEDRVRVELDRAEWSIAEVRDTTDRITDYLLIARTAGAERVVARVPYRSYVDWLLAAVRAAGSTEGAGDAAQ